MANRRLRNLLAAASVAALSVTGCTLKDQEAPPVTGPSEFAMAVNMTATPDHVVEDGASQSVIDIVVRDPDGQPMSGVQLRLEAWTTNLFGDVGTLSNRHVITGSNGRATVTYTAPLSQTPGYDTGSIVSVYATPIGTNYDNATGSSVGIRLVPATIIPVAGAPVAQFSYSPTTPAVGTMIQFNASSSFDAGGTIVSYEWNWGDGDPVATGVTEDHDYLAAGTYFVTLTVTDNSGLRTTITRPVTVVGP
jgi:PKD repeat protein